MSSRTLGNRASSRAVGLRISILGGGAAAPHTLPWPEYVASALVAGAAYLVNAAQTIANRPEEIPWITVLWGFGSKDLNASFVLGGTFGLLTLSIALFFSSEVKRLGSMAPRAFRAMFLLYALGVVGAFVSGHAGQVLDGYRDDPARVSAAVRWVLLFVELHQVTLVTLILALGHIYAAGIFSTVRANFGQAYRVYRRMAHWSLVLFVAGFVLLTLGLVIAVSTAGESDPEVKRLLGWAKVLLLLGEAVVLHLGHRRLHDPGRQT